MEGSAKSNIVVNLQVDGTASPEKVAGFIAALRDVVAKYEFAKVCRHCVEQIANLDADTRAQTVDGLLGLQKAFGGMLEEVTRG